MADAPTPVVKTPAAAAPELNKLQQTMIEVANDFAKSGVAKNAGEFLEAVKLKLGDGAKFTQDEWSKAYDGIKENKTIKDFTTKVGNLITDAGGLIKEKTGGIMDFLGDNKFGMIAAIGAPLLMMLMGMENPIMMLLGAVIAFAAGSFFGDKENGVLAQTTGIGAKAPEKEKEKGQQLTVGDTYTLSNEKSADGKDTIKKQQEILLNEKMEVIQTATLNDEQKAQARKQAAYILEGEFKGGKLIVSSMSVGQNSDTKTKIDFKDKTVELDVKDDKIKLESENKQDVANIEKAFKKSLDDTNYKDLLKKASEDKTIDSKEQSALAEMLGNLTRQNLPNADSKSATKPVSPAR